jgi:hypothetical protein
MFGSHRLSHGDFGLVVQALDDAAGKQFLSSDVVQDQFTMQAQRPSDLLHRLDAGAHRVATPFVEELPGPCGRVVIPELLKGFLEKVSAGRARCGKGWPVRIGLRIDI